MKRAELGRHLDVGLAAVREAGPIALEYFRKRLRVDDKRHGDYYDPVTDADRRIESSIRESLARTFPGERIAGEEHGSVGDGSTYWIIDPIDGTRSFISGMPTWGILLGLVVDDRPTLGIMHQPYTGETWIADPEHGARLQIGADEQPLRVRAEATLADAVLYSTHPSMLQLPRLLGRFELLSARCRLQRWGGDCYSYALLAQGCIDVVVDASLMPYDIVPLVPIIEGAGGVVTDIEGRTPLDGGTVIAAANATLHATALEIMRGRDTKD
ncbi:MAG: inositol monophosphatase family protein [Gammaproteobacteria bacterium]|nr:inositol monophosphatase family protein [Gammaproteobacteria bacterium]